MKIITVQKEGLIAEMGNWGVTHQYAEFFIAKCADDGHAVSLRPFAFNDTPHLNAPEQWLRCSAAFWAMAYRDACQQIEQVEAISAIRCLYYVAGMMGQGSVAKTIWVWWERTYELHRLPTLNRSQGSVNHQLEPLNRHRIFTTH